EEAGLHLRARHRELVGDAAERAASDSERRGAGGARLHRGAHGAQRLGDAAHGPPPQRDVAVEDALERLTGEDAREEAHGGPGVAAVEDTRGRTQPAEAGAPDADLAGCSLLDAHPERAEDAHGTEIVFPAREAANDRLALGQR